MRSRLFAWARLGLGAVVLASTTAAIAVPPAAASDGCGAVVIKPDGQPWACTFADDFNGTALDRTRWNVQQTATSGYTNAGECYVDSPKTVAVANGRLSLNLVRAGVPNACRMPSGWSFGTPWSAGSVSTYGTFTQAYGRWEIRAQFQNTGTPGIQSSIWMWPQTQKYGPWPMSGEIDIAEWYSKYYDRAIPYLHYGFDFLDPDATNLSCLVSPGDWHDYVLEWTPTSIQISYDGNVCLRNTHWMPVGMLSPMPFDQPFMLALTQVLGSGANAPVWNTPKTSSMKVDWVRVWS